MNTTLVGSHSEALTSKQLPAIVDHHLCPGQDDLYNTRWGTRAQRLLSRHITPMIGSTNLRSLIDERLGLWIESATTDEP
jgi:hypothetical protein